MRSRPQLNGWLSHFSLTLYLNFRNPQAIAYGYLVPIIFLLAFGGVFRADNPPLLSRMGQILTITILGGACFGLPSALVAEREQGVWRRYRRLAGFMPGRYAVAVLQPCFDAPGELPPNGFGFAALFVIGLAAATAGTQLFRWESGRTAASARWWVAAALASWAAVGAVAWETGRLKPVLPETAAWTNITEAEIAEIHFDGLPPDDDIVAPIAIAAASGDLAAKLSSWPPARIDDFGQAIRNLVAIAAVADLCADPRESGIARLAFQQIKTRFEPSIARQGLAWIILSPEDGQVVTKASELGLFRHPPERLVRQRSVIYARKYLGRLVGKIGE